MEENKNYSAENNTPSGDDKKLDAFEKMSRYDPLKKNEADIERESYLKNKSEKEGDIKIKSPFILWLDNFFYHYKWHTIIALFLVVAILLMCLQTCSKTVYDAHIMYAGGKNLRNLAEGESEMAYQPLYSAAQRFVSDYDGNGERNLSMLDIYLPSDEEITAADKNGASINYTLLKENDELFRQNMLYGDYYICLISKALFDEWTKTESTNPFAKITDYLPSDAKIAATQGDEGYLLASEYGVYLSSTPTAKNPGFNQLPDDTVIVFRKYIKTSGLGNNKKGEGYYKNAEATLKLLLENKAYS
ncbi:MAG: hypothetical protein IJY23_07220 [Clostridia bacterium]|nr:hypothetical protein [Clostridia bacterium]